MRTDIDIDTQQVRLPLNCMQGFSRCVAQYGDLISWQHGGEGRTEYGRVIGRIAQDKSKLDGQDCTGWLIVATLFCGLTSVGERWVDPQWVLTCYEIAHARENLDKFLADWPRSQKDNLRRWIAGEALPPKFLEGQNKRGAGPCTTLPAIAQKERTCPICGGHHPVGCCAQDGHGG